MHVCHTGKAWKCDCCCTVAASQYTAFEGWCGTRSRYWHAAAEQQVKKNKKENGKTLWGFPWAWSALARRNTIPWLLCESPEHALRSPAGTHTCAVMYRRPPWRAPQAESAKNDPRPEEKNFCIPEKSAFHTYAYCITRGRHRPAVKGFTRGRTPYAMCDRSIITHSLQNMIFQKWFSQLPFFPPFNL